jgi:hypothetical protein
VRIRKFNAAGSAQSDGLYSVGRNDNVFTVNGSSKITDILHPGADLGIRQNLNESKISTAILTLVIVVSAVLFVLWYSRPSQPAGFTTREFFSDDDGITWFVDDGTKLAPFDHHGKQAVLAKVFQCSNGKMFVGYLEKLSDDIKQNVEAARAAGPGHGGAVRADPTGFNGILLKKPRQAAWIKSNDPAAADIRKVTCPDGGTDLMPVVP